MEVTRNETVSYTIHFASAFVEDLTLVDADARELYRLLDKFFGESTSALPISRVIDGGGDTWELQPNGKYTLRWGAGDQSTQWCDYALEDIREAFGFKGDFR